LKSLSEIRRRKNCNLTGGKKGANRQRLATRATTRSPHDFLVLHHLRLIISHTRFCWYCISLTYKSCNVFGLITPRSDFKKASQTWPGRIYFIVSNLPYPLPPGSIFCRLNIVLRSICVHFLLILCHSESPARDWTIPALFRERPGWDQEDFLFREHGGVFDSGRVFPVESEWGTFPKATHQILPLNKTILPTTLVELTAIQSILGRGASSVCECAVNRPDRVWQYAVSQIHNYFGLLGYRRSITWILSSLAHSFSLINIFQYCHRDSTNPVTPANSITLSRWANSPLWYRNISGNWHPDFETRRYSPRDSIGNQRAVLVNKFEPLHLQPPEFENLPLHPAGHGLYSVNGPGFHTNQSQCSITHALGYQISHHASKNTRGSSYLQPTINAIYKLEIPLCSSFSHIPIATPLRQPEPSPTGLPGADY